MNFEEKMPFCAFHTFHLEFDFKAYLYIHLKASKYEIIVYVEG